MKRILSIAFILILFSCSKDEYKEIDVSNTLNLAMSSQYAVIVEPYASYHQESNQNSNILSYGRIGEVVEVTGSTINNNEELWYHFEDGWLSQETIQIYTNKLQASYAAKNFSNN